MPQGSESGANAILPMSSGAGPVVEGKVNGGGKALGVGCVAWGAGVGVAVVVAVAVAVA